MRQFTLSKAALRILIQQLESKGDGFTIKQLRLLDKSILILEEPIKDYNETIDREIKIAKEAVAQDPQNGSFIEDINQNLNKKLDEYTDTIGQEQVTIRLEDEQFSFVQEILETSQGFRGNKAVRQLILTIDDALQNAIEVKN